MLCWDNFLFLFLFFGQFSVNLSDNFSGTNPELSQERTLTERVSYFLFVLMSVSGGVHGDFLKPFRKSPALRGVSFKCLALKF